jgi:hypothetical protein
MTNEQTLSSFLDGIAKYLLMALKCDAISFHTRGTEGRLLLHFERGFSGDSSKIIMRPLPSSPITTAAYEDEIVHFEHPHKIPEKDLLVTLKGPVKEYISVPVECGCGVLTVYFSRTRRSNPEEKNILEKTAAAVGSYLRTERTRLNSVREMKFRENLTMLGNIFDNESNLHSALIKSARLIYETYRFNEFNVYISGNGIAQTLDFDLRNGGRLRVVKGHLSKRNYPFLYYGDVDAGRTRHFKSVSFDVSRHAVIASNSTMFGGRFWLEFKFRNVDQLPASTANLIAAYGVLVSRTLSQEEGSQREANFMQWTGALRHLVEKALSGIDISELMREMATVVVESDLSPFCRILLCDHESKEFKTTSIAQVRPLTWHLDNSPPLPLDNTFFHARALNEQKAVIFDQSRQDMKMRDNEFKMLMPEGARRGVLLPLLYEGSTMGLLVAGDFRGFGRSNDYELTALFLQSLSQVISLALALQMASRTAPEIREGNKKLTMKRREQISVESQESPAPGIRSRINGPLASILASCEYLKGNTPELTVEVDRYLNVIERNAEKIHEITEGFVDSR